MSYRDSQRGRGETRSRRDSTGSQGSSRAGTPTDSRGRSDSPHRPSDTQRSRSPPQEARRTPSPSRSYAQQSSDRPPSYSGPGPRGAPAYRGGQTPRGGPAPRGGSAPRGQGGYTGPPRGAAPGGQSKTAGKKVMFTQVLPEKEVADFEKKSVESKSNVKQAAQREVRSKKNRAKGPKINLPLARRPGYGTKGQAVNLRANFFTMFFRGKGYNFYAYHMKIEPEPKLKRHVKQVLKQLVMKCDHIRGCLSATDEVTWIISCKELPFDSTFARVDPDENGRYTTEYKCTFELMDGAPIPLHNLLEGLKNPDIHEKVSDEDYVVQMLNLVMTSGAYGNTGITIVDKGRTKFFYTDERQESMNLGGGLDVLRGCISSVRPAGNRILLNINVSNSAFYQPINLAQFVQEVLTANYGDLDTLNRYLRNVKVELTYLPTILDDFKEKAYRIANIWGLASKEDEQKCQGGKPPQVRKFGAGPDDVRFYWIREQGSPGSYVTVSQYFAEVYDITLRDRSKPVINIGNHTRPIYLPVELVFIKNGQIFNGELNTMQRQNIIKFSCRQPPDNFETIRTLGRDIMGITAGHFHNRSIKFSDEMIVVPARCLDAPTLKYGTRAEKPRKGAWNLVGKTFTSGVRIETYVVIWFRSGYTRCALDQIQSATQGLARKMNEMGMAIRSPQAMEAVDLQGNLLQQNERIFQSLSKWANKRPQLILIVLPTNQDRVFRHVKWVADCKLGLANHCVLVDKFSKGNPQYMANNALKINLKLGGVNHNLDQSSAGILSQGKTMVVGIDATHPSSTELENFPTVAAIVASTDGRLGQWPGDARIQTSKQEILENLMEMMLGRLHLWQSIHKSLPQNILIYRDGVSEGQYGEVVGTELKAIRDAIEKLYKGPKPKITLLVVTKRHHVRFYPTNDQGCDDKNNCKNGTIVDRSITRPWYFDFYLQAQAPLQGSARPAHYVVMHDEIFSQNPRGAADELQQLTHNICYMMARCTRSISYGTPAFLADRYCDRARKYVLAHYDAKSFERPDVKKINLAPTQSEVRVHQSLANTMVYI